MAGWIRQSGGTAKKLASGARLFFLHPQVAALPCDQCKERLYDLETGEPKRYRSGQNRTWQYYEGPRYAPACLHGVRCPKGNIHTAKDVEWNWRNLKCFVVWRRWRVDPAAYRLDNFTREMFALLSDVERECSEDRLTKKLATSIAGAIVRAVHGS